MRVFLTLPLETQTALDIHRWCELCWPGLAKRTPVQNYHLTLAFLGDTDDGQLNQLSEMLDGFQHPTIKLTLDQLGYWPDTNIMWLGASKPNEELMALQAKCKKAANRIGARGNGRKFTPHVTLARNLNVPPSPALIEPCFKCFADELELWQSVLHSTGARYSTIGSWRLHSRTL